MNFGTVDTLSGLPLEGTTDVSVTCDQVSGTVVTVCANFGAGSGGASSGARHLLSGSAELDYQLFTDAGRNIPWGAYNAPALGLPQTIRLAASDGTATALVPVYGKVFGNQPDTATGSYLSSLSGGDVSFIYAEGDSLNCSAPMGGSTAQTAFAVQAAVAANCLIEADNIDFGSQGILDEDITAVGGLNISCTPGVNYSIAMDGGLSGAADPEQRLMRSGANSIVYGLYADANHTTPWGAQAGTVVSGTGAGDVEIPVYGRVPPQASVPAGNYADTVVVTITYF